MALNLRGLSAEAADARLRQAEGLQRLAAKVPRWAAVENLSYPPRLSLEQCSSERTACYKADVVRRLVGEKPQRMADLTGGFGVDFSFMAPLFARPVYVERQEELCRIAHHNFPLLGLGHAEIVNGDGTDFLKEMAAADFLFIDPARRDQTGRKTVLIEDCEPNLVDFLSLLLEKAPYTMVKLSPMLDIHRAITSLSAATILSSTIAEMQTSSSISWNLLLPTMAWPACWISMTLPDLLARITWLISTAGLIFRVPELPERGTATSCSFPEQSKSPKKRCSHVRIFCLKRVQRLRRRNMDAVPD